MFIRLKGGSFFVMLLISLLTPLQLIAHSDPMVSEKHELAPFNSVDFSGIGNLHITQSDKQGLTVEAPENLLPLVQVYVKEKTLYIDMNSTNLTTPVTLNYYLSIKELTNINSFGSSTILIPDGLKSNALNLSLSNFGEANVNVTVKKLTVNIEGGSKVDAKGIASEQIISIMGAGEFNGNKLSGTNATVNISGPGIARINVSDELNINLLGEGSVKYCGNPSLNKQISGAGVVMPLGDSACSG